MNENEMSKTKNQQYKGNEISFDREWLGVILFARVDDTVLGRFFIKYSEFREKAQR